MRYEIFLPEFFKRTSKDLKKKYPNVIQDLKTALRVVESNPELSRTLHGFADVKKLRVQNSDVTKGKRGGYRLIYLIASSIERFLAAVRLRKRVEKAYLYGSHTRAQATKWSDIDLAITA